MENISTDKYSIRNTCPEFWKWAFFGRDPHGFKEEVEFWNETHGDKLLLTESDDMPFITRQMFELYFNRNPYSRITYIIYKIKAFIQIKIIGRYRDRELYYYIYKLKFDRLMRLIKYIILGK